jgi:hypothetical protein
VSRATSGVQVRSDFCNGGNLSDKAERMLAGMTGIGASFVRANPAVMAGMTSRVVCTARPAISTSPKMLKMSILLIQENFVHQGKKILFIKE